MSSVSTNAVNVGLSFSGSLQPVPLGTATLDADYSRSSSTIVIPPGSLTGSITLTAIDDLQDESDESIRVDISTVVNGKENGSQWVRAYITDDDYTGVSLGLTGSPIAEAGGVATVTATLTGVSPGFVQVNLNVLGDMGTATPSIDYVRSSDVITIPAGSLTGSVTLTAVQDTVSEPSETIKVTAASVIYGTVAAPSAVEAIIIDDDPVPVFEMDVQGNSVSIVDGDSTPSSTDHTDFGQLLVTSGTAVRTYTIRNTGSAALNLGGTPIVVVGGAQASEFVVTQQPSTPVAPAGTTTFQVTFDPVGVGVRSSTLSIANNDSDENPYNYSIQGSGAAAALGVAPASTSLTSGAWSGRTIAVTGNVSWTTATNAAWLAVTGGSSGTSNGTVTFSVATNAGVFARTGGVMVAGGGLARTCMVVQAGIPAQRIIELGGNIIFGNVVTGRTKTATLTIANNGNAALTVTSISYPGGFTGAWSGSIAASNSTNVTVTFSPVAVATYGGTITVNSDKTSGTNTITVSGNGTILRLEAQDDASFGMVSNRFGFNINWTSGRVVVVDACTNLNNPVWTPLQTNTLGANPVYFGDSKWTNYLGRFYRIRAP